MDVDSFAEGFEQVPVAAQVGHYAELNLGIIGAHHHPALFPGHEGLADFAALGGADRNVLQVGVRAGKPSCRRKRLVERGVDPAVAGTHIRREGLDVGAKQFPQAAIRKYGLDDGTAVRELLKRLFIGRPVAFAWLFRLGVELEFLEYDLPYLLGRIDVERRLARQFAHQRLLFGGLHPEAVGISPKRVKVDFNAVHFHPGEHSDERLLDTGVEFLQAGVGALHFGFQRIGERQQHGGLQKMVRAGIFGGAEKGALLLSRGRPELDSEISRGQDVELVAALRAQQIMHYFQVLKRAR